VVRRISNVNTVYTALAKLNTAYVLYTVRVLYYSYSYSEKNIFSNVKKRLLGSFSNAIFSEV
jgi:hypothetical protein